MHTTGIPVPDRPGESGAQHVRSGADPADVLQHQIAVQTAPRLLPAAAGGARQPLGAGAAHRRHHDQFRALFEDVRRVRPQFRSCHSPDQHHDSQILPIRRHYRRNSGLYSCLQFKKKFHSIN